jgi:hypothetical protein
MFNHILYINAAVEICLASEKSADKVWQLHKFIFDVMAADKQCCFKLFEK